jgi:hypothetical protein
MATTRGASGEPLATYSERLVEVRREFTLYDDGVLVKARWFPNQRIEHVVKLDSLKGEYQEITVRYRMYRYAGGSWRPVRWCTPRASTMPGTRLLE